MKIRSPRRRSLAVLVILALGCLTLTGCDSKAGTAAVVNGQKISENDLSSYLTPGAPPIPSGNGTTSTPARTFVLRLLIQTKVFPLLLVAGGTPASDGVLDASKASILQGSTEQNLTDQITKSGLKAKFEPVYLRYLELSRYLQDKLTDPKKQQSALAAVKDAVSISPRYGSWDPIGLSLVDLGKKQLPSMLSFDGTLPGDVKLPASQ